MIGGLVYFGTLQEEKRGKGLEVQRKEQFRQIEESGLWKHPPELAESVTDVEQRMIAEAGKAGRDKLENLKKMKKQIHKEIDEKKMDIVIAFHNKVKQVHEKHTKKRG